MIHVQLPSNPHPVAKDEPAPYRKETTDTYFRVKPARQEYKGERYFKRMANNTEHVVMICMESNKKHRGGKVMFGVYYIKYSTFIGNYAWCEGKWLDVIPKSEWDRMFSKVIKELK